MQRVGHPPFRHRRPCRAECLRGDLTAVERQARARTRLVLAAEEIAIEDLEVEERGEPAGRRGARFLGFLGRRHTCSRQVSGPALRTIISVTVEA